MPVSAINAATAYAKAAQAGDGPGLAARETPGAGDFAGMVKDALGSAAGAGKSAEGTAAQALTGQAEMSDVVISVANAELALQTVVAVRDKVVQAYQDILRMPI
ncbi:MAG: flagellar hook-basal body complex protein FliE [Rhodospirillaceae bacterium]|jgi:flagellar hook-basal body complex protein FliE|nr:flagellar hook-basal body complex protein FliE [Rhodospirillaceae bacterium]MBT6116931.1 flagellar hook-basal body complex protein FliE [Rhodospirillaceae bacterium]